MPVNAWVMLGIPILMFVFLVWDRFPAWLVFMGTLTTAMTLRLAPAEALLTGFSNTGVLTVAATGLMSMLNAAGLIGGIGGSSPMIALSAVYVGTILMTNVITNAAAAFMFQVALSLANSLGVSFMPFAMALMSAATCAFINPAGLQTNLMVQGPGGYSFGDFARVGAPLTILVGAVVLSPAPLVYGFE